MSSQRSPLEQRILALARRRYPPGNADGVFAFELGPRLCRGRSMPERTLRVFVPWKDPSCTAMPPLVVRSGNARIRVRPDVIATGAQPLAGDAPTSYFTGLHVGAALQARTRFGATGLLLTAEQRPTHLVTAGHLFAERDREAAVRAARQGTNARVIGRLVCNLLDERPGGLTHAIDAALVELNAFGTALAEATHHRKAPQPIAVLSLAEAGRTAVLAFRATANDYSESSDVHSVAECHFAAAARPRGYAVQDVLCTERQLTRAGDSGTLFTTAGQQRAAVGLCIGVDGRRTLLEPLERALHYFDHARPGLSLWKGIRT